MASTVPEASGNKAPEAALPSIEPVTVPETTERGLLTDHPAIAYPDSAKGQQGTVVLQVLIDRDGTVEDAKFLQGSLAFTRAAIDGVTVATGSDGVAIAPALTADGTPGSYVVTASVSNPARAGSQTAFTLVNERSS